MIKSLLPRVHSILSELWENSLATLEMTPLPKDIQEQTAENLVFLCHQIKGNLEFPFFFNNYKL